MRFNCNLSSRLDYCEVLVKHCGTPLTAASPKAYPEGLYLLRALSLFFLLLLNCQGSNKFKNYVSP